MKTTDRYHKYVELPEKQAKNLMNASGKYKEVDDKTLDGVKYLILERVS